ncbi:MAG: hypothetical protein OHK0053_09100 [Microscillaceae bacterium]
MGLWTGLSPQVSSQGKPKKDPVLVQIGADPVKKSEFVYVYEKNTRNRDSLYLKAHLDSYLDLFIKFKLKIQDAKAQKIADNPDFIREFNSYLEILAKPYLTDAACLERLASEAYERKKEMVKVAHILLKLPEIEDPHDTLKAYQQMEEIVKRAQSGEDFGKLARQFSQDPKSNQSQGQLGFITALQTVHAFENVAYQTPVGQISGIFRTKFGYHILKVEERRPNPGEVEVAHLMVQLAPGASPEEEMAAKTKIDKLYAELQAGGNWERLCRENSDDATSRQAGGKLPRFGIGQVLPEFEQAAFALERKGDISTPLRTAYGWHILRLLDKKSLPNREEALNGLKTEISKSERANVCERALIRQLQTQYDWREYPDVLARTLAKADKRLSQGGWSYQANDPLLEETLFSFRPRGQEARNYKVREFIEYVYNAQVPRPALDSAAFAMYQYYQQFYRKATLDFERERLPEKYPEYALLMQEYREGSMLYEVMNRNVWEKSIQDTTSLRQFYEQNADRYQWGERATAAIFELQNPNSLDALKAYLLKNIFPVNGLVFDNLYFEKDEITLSEASVKTIKEVAKLLKQRPDLRVEVAGHADPSESDTLARARILPVVKYLNFEKVAPSQIITKDFGFTKLASRTERARNRRIEFRFYTTEKKELENLFREEQLGDIQIQEGVYEKDKNAWLQKVSWKPGSYTLNADGKMVYIEIYDLKDPRPKTYREARGNAINDFQVSLEEQWLQTLSQKYPVVRNQKEIDKLIRK